MRRLFIVILFFVFTLCPAPARADDGVVVASGAMGWRPYLMLDPTNGKVTGVLHDILQQACDNLGLSLVFADYPWKRALDNLQHGDVDVLCGIYWTEGRSKTFRFSSPVFKDEIRIFVTEPFEIDSLDDLKGKKGDRPLGGSYGDDFDEYARKNLDLTQVTTKELSFSRLQRGFTEYYVCALADCMHYLKTQGLTEEIRPLPYVVAENSVYFAFSRSSKNPQRDTALIEELERLRKDGTVDEILYSYCPTLSPSTP